MLHAIMESQGIDDKYVENSVMSEFSKNEEKK